ncbi:RNA polymerase sigma factor [Cyclobacterium qasimii]|uniref:RNA polymerase ECF-type sigma factor n=2 Tax=Cyclobacterium qasimii TaxID=1350429 RepID=S7VN70_9BACT|nr:sigma-70 family RNA polymerase sigma factor [Cyclobacterium qasimii]EPR71426.1 RNA polymerase ECF-type sigma factor [Cyclobacterium qasimii M12-11B]GEO20589.1 DNA-directed RNA polymerase sigma-70 factor [Cyclobacterium qasimii]
MNEPYPNNNRSVKNFPFENHSNEKLRVSDAYLWQQFKEGSETAFIKIYNENFSLLLNYGYQLTGNQELIEDCVQDIFIYLRQRRKSLGSTDCIKFYLMKCMKRKLIKEIKKSKISFSLESQEGFSITFSHEDFLIDQQIELEKSEKLNVALSLLSEKKREAIYYFYFQNLNYSQISELFGFSHIKSARNLVYKALSTLKNAME